MFVKNVEIEDLFVPECLQSYAQQVLAYKITPLCDSFGYFSKHSYNLIFSKSHLLQHFKNKTTKEITRNLKAKVPPIGFRASKLG